jgi:NAD(P)-dependent dehydrogenase (short-subunit alcohol dehydrogenase family)
VGTRLAGKHALITGGSRGIGQAIAEAFAAEGCTLTLNARDPDRLQQRCDAIARDHGVEVVAAPCDVTDGNAVRAIVAAVDAVRPIDVLVNNAGIHVPNRFIDYSFEQFRAVMESNVYSVFHVTQATLPGMMERRQGRVINLASSAGKWGSRNQSAYNASKHAVVGLTRCLGLEMAPYNVLVNAICPWIVDTDMATGFMEQHASVLGIGQEELAARFSAAAPLQRWIEPREVAGLAVYLASDDASYINGQAWAVDGGYTMI